VVPCNKANVQMQMYPPKAGMHVNALFAVCSQSLEFKSSRGTVTVFSSTAMSSLLRTRSKNRLHWRRSYPSACFRSLKRPILDMVAVHLTARRMLGSKAKK